MPGSTPMLLEQSVRRNIGVLPKVGFTSVILSVAGVLYTFASCAQLVRNSDIFENEIGNKRLLNDDHRGTLKTQNHYRCLEASPIE